MNCDEILSRSSTSATFQTMMCSKPRLFTLPLPHLQQLAEPPQTTRGCIALSPSSRPPEENEDNNYPSATLHRTWSP
eukprot:2017639-Pyramimonas_sp.AAC.1